MRIHTTKDGTRIKLRDMTDAHLENTIRLLERKAAEGIIVCSGGGLCPDEFWYDEERLEGKDALEHMRYDAYVKERARRISKRSWSPLMGVPRQKRMGTVTEEMREAGAQVASDILDALVSFQMDGLGGSKKWTEFASGHSGKNMDLIKQYVNGEIDSVTAIYIAMHRESVTPDANTSGA